MGEANRLKKELLTQHRRMLDSSESRDIIWIMTYTSALVQSLKQDEKGFRCDPGQASTLADLAVRHALSYLDDTINRSGEDNAP